MKLYEVPRNTRVRVLEDVSGPLGARSFKVGDEVTFHHVDGMYSYCTWGGAVCHLKAWTEVEVVT